MGSPSKERDVAERANSASTCNFAPYADPKPRPTLTTFDCGRYPAVAGPNNENFLACVSNPPEDPEKGWPVNYDRTAVGGLGYDLEFHPYWNVKHIDVANWRDSYHSNSFPAPRRGHAMTPQGNGNSSKVWLFGGLATVPAQKNPVVVQQRVGKCTVIDPAGIEVAAVCDQDADRKFTEICVVGALCNVANPNNGGNQIRP